MAGLEAGREMAICLAVQVRCLQAILSFSLTRVCRGRDGEAHGSTQVSQSEDPGV